MKISGAFLGIAATAQDRSPFAGAIVEHRRVISSQLKVDNRGLLNRISQLFAKASARRAERAAEKERSYIVSGNDLSYPAINNFSDQEFESDIEG